MDDFPVFAEDKARLRAALAVIRSFLGETLGLELRDERTRLAPAGAGAPFLGFRVFLVVVRFDGRKLARLRRRVRALPGGAGVLGGRVGVHPAAELAGRGGGVSAADRAPCQAVGHHFHQREVLAPGEDEAAHLVAAIDSGFQVPEQTGIGFGLFRDRGQVERHVVVIGKRSTQEGRSSRLPRGPRRCQAAASSSIHRNAARARNPDPVSPWRAATSSAMPSTRAGTVMLVRRALPDRRAAHPAISSTGEAPIQAGEPADRLVPAADEQDDQPAAYRADGSHGSDNPSAILSMVAVPNCPAG